MSLLYLHQFGYRIAHSTDMALDNMQELITDAIDANKFSIGIFLDLAKAFGTVNQDNLVKKLQIYGLRGLPLQSAVV